MIKVLSITDDIILRPNHLYDSMSDFHYWNLERFIKLSFERLGIDHKVKRYPYTMYSVRLKSGHTRWTQGEYDEKLGYHIKYHLEYKRYKWAKLFIRRPKDWNKLNISILNAMEYIRLRKHFFWTPSTWKNALNNIFIRIKK